MGLGPGFRLSGSSSGCDHVVTYGPKNPNPLRFKVTHVMKFKNCTALKVNYPDATNYEGNKVLVVKNTKNWGKVTKLDPHFDKGDDFLIARFAPTVRGWQDALRFASVYPK